MVWSCKRCTLHNDDSNNSCEACGGPKTPSMPNVEPFDEGMPRLNNQHEEHDLISFTEPILMQPPSRSSSVTSCSSSKIGTVNTTFSSSVTGSLQSSEESSSKNKVINVRPIAPTADVSESESTNCIVSTPSNVSQRPPQISPSGDLNDLIFVDNHFRGKYKVNFSYR